MVQNAGMLLSVVVLYDRSAHFDVLERPSHERFVWTQPVLIAVTDV